MLAKVMDEMETIDETAELEVPVVKQRDDNVETDDSKLSVKQTAYDENLFSDDEEEEFEFRRGMTGNVEKHTVSSVRAAIMKYNHYYEEIKGECVPYFDFDKVFKTEKELNDFIPIGMDALEQAFEAVFEAPAILYYASSHGWSKKGFKFSYHVVVRKIGKYACGVDVQNTFVSRLDEALADSGLKCDVSVYKAAGSRQLMRTIYSTKEEDKRTMKPIGLGGAISDDQFKNYLITWTEGEKLIAMPKAVEKKKEEKVDSEDAWEHIGDNGEYGSDKRVLTFEQITQIVNGLNTERFGDGKYDAWCYLLWAVARWQDATKADEDEVIGMLDSYCQKCAGYKSNIDVMKKYNQAFKRDGNSGKAITVGTLIHWLKEDNYSVYCNLFMKQAAVETQVVQSFDWRDSYCWVDFANETMSKVWDSEDDLNAHMVKNLPRVLALIQREKGFYLKKEICEGGVFSIVDTIKGAINFRIKYVGVKIDKRTKDKKPQKTVETIALSEYLANHDILKLFSNIGCYPDSNVKKCPDHIYNIWSGYQAEQVTVDEDKITEIQFILRELWASGDENLYKYILAWLRFVVANPAEMTKVALFLYSQEGAGKGTIVDFMLEYVLGRGLSHYYTGIDEVVEKHDTNKKGRKLIYINEMGSTREQFMSNFDKMKGIITDPTITENPKGHSIIQVDNICNVIMSTNHKNSLYLTDTDRRYTCIEVSNSRCGDRYKQWWAETRKKIMNQDVGNHFYSWLLSLDPTQLPSPHQVYQTELRNEITELSRDNVLVFADWLIETENNKSSESEETKRETIKAAAAYEEYVEWCRQSGERVKARRLFGMAVKAVLPHKRLKTGLVYEIKKLEP